MKPVNLIICLLLTLLSCQHKHTEDQHVMEEAAKIHQKIIEQEKLVNKTINEFISTCENLSQDSPLCDSLLVINKDFLAWEESLVEVPGYEEEHDHDHDHNQSVEVTAEEMLSIQKQLLKEIKNLQFRCSNLEASSK